MDEMIFTGFGVEIFKRSGRYIIKYDSGEIVSKMLEDEISEEEVLKVQKSERDAYEVLLACERRRLKGKK